MCTHYAVIKRTLEEPVPGPSGVPVRTFYGVVNRKYLVEETAALKLPAAILSAQYLNDQLVLIQKLGASRINDFHDMQMVGEELLGNDRYEEPETTH